MQPRQLLDDIAAWRSAIGISLAVRRLRERCCAITDRGERRPPSIRLADKLRSLRPLEPEVFRRCVSSDIGDRFDIDTLRDAPSACAMPEAEELLALDSMLPVHNDSGLEWRHECLRSLGDQDEPYLSARGLLSRRDRRGRLFRMRVWARGTGALDGPPPWLCRRAGATPETQGSLGRPDPPR